MRNRAIVAEYKYDTTNTMKMNEKEYYSVIVKRGMDKLLARIGIWQDSLSIPMRVVVTKL